MEVILEIASGLLLVGAVYGAMDAKHKAAMKILDRTEQDLRGLSEKFVTQVQFNQVIMQLREEREFLRQEIHVVQRDIKEILAKIK